MNDISTSESGRPTSKRGGRGRSAGTSLRRNWPVLACAAALVVASGTGGAVAAGLITSSKIKDYTIQNRDIASNAISVRNIKSGSVQARDLTSAARNSLKGTPGAAGSTWLSGAGAPGSLAANNGDWYLDTTAQAIYTRVGGAWGFVVDITGATGSKGDKGDAGDDGKAGAVWFNGTGVPASTLGVDGDWDVDTATGQAYQKADGSWTFRVNLKGAQGEKGLTGDKGTTGDKGDKGDAGTNGDDGFDGATWYTGAGVPASTLGANRDLYLDTATSDVYRKSSGAWSLLTNIKGQKGDPGTNGTAGTNGADGTVWLTGAGAPSAAAGKNGDLYLNTTNGDVYQKGSGAWGSSIANLTGPAGSNGSGGGTTWLSGKDAPETSEGANGNYYLATTTGAVYLKSAGAWASIYTPPAASGSAVLAVQATKTADAQVLPLAQGSNTGSQVFFNNVVRQDTSVGTYDAGTSTFTAAVEGLYQVQAAIRTADAATASQTVGAVLWASVDNAAAASVNTTITDYPPVTGSNLPPGVKGRGFMQVTVYLTAGQTVRIMGLGANSSTAMQAMTTDGSSNLLITKM